MREICGLSFEEFRRKAEEFHGYPAPGLLVGGLMVDLARRNLPAGEFFDVLCETNSCLPDAVQILTPCTCGNGWLKIIPLGRYALTFFEKRSGEGVRVSVDAEKLEKYPEVKNWFFRLKPKKEQKEDLLISQIFEGGDDLFRVSSVRVDESHLGPKHGGSVVLCPSCGEAYPREDGERCRVCQGFLLYSENRQYDRDK